jgi:hypothetical protein
MAINRPPFFAVAAGSNGAGPVTVGASQGGATQVGDIVTAVFQGASTPVVVTADTFERVVSIAGQIQQNSSSNLSGNTYVWLVIPQGWKSLQ